MSCNDRRWGQSGAALLLNAFDSVVFFCIIEATCSPRFFSDQRAQGELFAFLLMADLFGWLASSPVHPLIASCVFHYEFEFIYPFADGNGRMGRMWQTLILSQWQPMLAYLPVETLIKKRQTDYYEALAAADKVDDSTSFIEFMLQALLDTMTEAITKPSEKVSEKTSEKIIRALHYNHAMTIAELAKNFGLSTRSIERNLQKLQKEGRLRRIGPQKGGYWEVVQ